MTKLVNFEDNIYMVLARIKMFKDLLSLDADPELFFNKTLDDIDFINATLESLLKDLLNNKRLIEREGLLNHLSELEYQFNQALSDFTRDEKMFPPDTNLSIKENISGIQTKSRDRQLKAENRGFPGASGDSILEFSKPHEPVVSSNELSELLRAF